MSRENKRVVICGKTVKTGDIVKVKFRKLEDVLMDKRLHCRVSEVLQHYKISDHMNSFCAGTGHFVVKDVASDPHELYLSEQRFFSMPSLGGAPGTKQAPQPDPNLMPEIRVEDHNDPHHQWWPLNEVLVESLEVETHVADSYFSEAHQLSLLVIDSVLYVNGAPLTNADSKIFEMFEKVMADAAINRMFQDNSKDKQTEDEDF